MFPHVVAMIPKLWDLLEQFMKDAMTYSTYPVIDVLQLFIHFNDAQISATNKFADVDDLKTALRYLSAVGSIIYFDESESAGNFVFVKPEWITESLKSLFVHDGEERFTYQIEYQEQYDVSEREFKQEKEMLLKNGYTKKTFMR